MLISRLERTSDPGLQTDHKRVCDLNLCYSYISLLGISRICRTSTKSQDSSRKEPGECTDVVAKYIREPTNRRLLHDGVFGLLHLPSVHAYRAKVNDVSESHLPASWKQPDLRLVFKVFSPCFRCFAR